MAKKNPIELEVDKVEGQWEEFVETQIPILRWLITPGANQLVSTFIRVQEECDETVADFFMPLYSPMDDVHTYSFDLVKELNERMLEACESLADDPDTYVHWPQLSFFDRENGFDSLLMACSEIIKLLGDGFENLVLVLRPSKLPSAKDWRLWCESLAQVSDNKNLWPSELRIVLLDDAKYPTLNKTANDYPGNIHSMVPPVNLKQAMTEVFDKADDGSPGAAYRKHFVAMHHAVEENSIKDVEDCSERALAIAGENQWYDLWVAVLLLRASAYLANERADDAISDYQTAQRFAKMGHEQGMEGCDKQWIFALLLEGGAWLLVKKWLEAAQVYMASAELSNEFEEHFFHMDSWRMASFCYEKQKQNEREWDSSCRALDAAALLKDEEREASTLPYVGESLLRLAPNENDKWEADQKMKEYLGDDWLQMIAQPEEAEAC